MKTAKTPLEREDGPQLYLDCDGVLADLRPAAVELLGMPPEVFQARWGAPRFWRQLAEGPGWVERIRLMPDAGRLCEAVRHLDPIVLVLGVPRGSSQGQSMTAWLAQHLPNTRVLSCMSINGQLNRRPGDVLVDGTELYRQDWEQAGGRFILHRNVEATLAALSRLFTLNAVVPEA